MKQQAKKRVRLEAKEYLDGFGIPWDQYDAGKIVYWCDPFNNREVKEWANQVVFTHKQTDKQIRLTEIHADPESGEIWQAGSNYGNLTL